MIRIDSSWSGLPQAPNIIAPRQSGLTSTPGAAEQAVLHRRNPRRRENREHPRLQQLHVDRGRRAPRLALAAEPSEREYSFVDATSFVLMRRHAIYEAFAFDGDFASAGFVELRA